MSAARPPSIEVTRPPSKRSVTGSSTRPSTVYGTVRSATSTPSAPSACGATKISPPGKFAPSPGSSLVASVFHGRPPTRSVRSVPARPRIRIVSASFTSAISDCAASTRSGCGLRQLAGEELGVDQAHVDLPAAVADDGLHQLEARVGLVAARRLGEKERDVGSRGAFEHARRRVAQRALTGPELEPRLAARVLHRRRELRALRGERLVDGDEHALAGLQS